jgi:glutamate synthase domain-containing protein 3
MAELGFRTVDEMIGRVDRLEANDALQHFKADGLDLTALLTPAQRSSPTSDVRCTQRQDHGLATVLDQELIRAAEVALQGREKIRLERPIRNTDRATGTMLSHEVARRHGEALLPEDSIHVKLSGSAGQSFGAWLAKGITFELEGDANDYVGKGLSGGRIVVYPSESSPFAAEDNVLVGNVVLYGAVSGEAYFRGRAAERFAVRNSGARAVVEGVGDHGCEYMTGGRVLVLGSIGRNFAAGMSGGIAYLWDREGALAQRVNRGLVELERVEPGPEVREVRALAAKHLLYTGSPVAADFLRRWGETSHQLIKVMPRDYKRALERRSPRSSGTPHGGRREVAHG